MRSASVFFAACFLLSAYPAGARAQAGRFEKEPDGVLLHLPNGVLKAQLISSSIVRVAFAKDPAFFARKTIDRLERAPYAGSWKLETAPTRLTLVTPALSVAIDRVDGSVRFLDHRGKPILAEAGRSMETAQVQGDDTFHVRQQWVADPDESLYGLGQQQLGTLDIKGYDLDMWQHNTNVVVPFLVSSKGYGLFWENTSFTRFGDLRQFEAIPAEDLLDKDGKPGGLTAQPLDGSAPPADTADIGFSYRFVRGAPRPRVKSTRWEGSILAPATGDYQFQAYSNGGIKVWIDGAKVMDHWRQSWLTSNDQVKLRLEAGKRYPVKIEWDAEQGNTIRFLWKTPSADANTSLWSEVGEGVDYDFVYGPDLDRVVAGYRLLTGRATMAPSWAFGLWQSRQRYETSQQSLDVLNEFRKRQIPFDNIVQDWQYWPMDAWGSHQFDPVRFPDPDGWIKTIHEKNAHVMISVWGKFNPNTDNAKEMQAKGYLYQPNIDDHLRDWIGYPYTFYDAFNPGARKLFWSQISTNLFQRGIDAWWMDASEPDLTASPPTLEGQKKYMNPTAMGTASRMLNGYALMNSEGIYEGQRSVAPNQRVFILTRSGYAGQQRYAASTWSGDITSTWTALAKQIPAGLGFSLSGVPYWTTDTGGYTMQRKFSTPDPKPEDEDEWRELNARWFEFSTFCPLLRVHGELRPREMWTLGDESSAPYQAELKSDRLRYRMFPYLYSLAGAVTQQDSTFMRPLVMDFADDKVARELTDEYMFGPALLVAPITQYKARSRPVYLPKGAGWYDFWTGVRHPSGAWDAPAPYDAIPVFVREGSIIPFGPELQYIAEKPSDPTTLYVYEGADGRLVLYEDQGVNYDYEKGRFAEIPIAWNEAHKTLTIGKRKGSFAGMLERRTFQLVVVSGASPVGFSFDPKPVRTVAYDGSEVKVALK